MFKIGNCRLKGILSEHGITQQELADKIKMPRSQVSDYIHNRKKMSLTTAKIISSVLDDCNIEDLYEWIPVRLSERKKYR